MITTKRLPDWEQRLDAFVKECRFKRRVISIPAKPDDFDCGLFILEAIYQMTGTHMVCEAYRDATTFDKVTSGMAIFDFYVSQIAATYGLRAIRPSESSKGDVLTFEWSEKFNARPMGIKMGSYAAIPGETSLGYIRSNLATSAFRV